MKPKKETLMRLAAYGEDAERTKNAISAKLKRLRHAIKERIGEEPVTDPELRILRPVRR